MTRLLKAPRSVVYRALLDPQAVAVWKVPPGMRSEIHEFDARPGGAFRVSLTYEEQSGVGKTTARTDTYHGRFAELIPDEKIVELIEFETSDPAMAGEMTITTTLADEDGGTRLTAVHAGLPPGVPESDNELGWNLSLANLAAFVEGRVS